jgi:hypothetical protein
MPTNALQIAQYKDLGETWHSHRAARIIQRHIQFGRHCRLDLDTLLAGIARRIRHANVESAANNTDSVGSPSLAQAGDHISQALPEGSGVVRPQGGRNPRKD